MTDTMIEARKLTKRYGEITALKDVSFEVKKGEVLGFLGPNGAGKTTAMKILTCFIAPTSGTAKVNGCDVFEDPMGVRKSLGYLPESNPLYTEMLVVEFLEWIARMRGLVGEQAKKRVRKVVEETAIGDVVSSEIRTLSKGYRQRVGLAQALMHEPAILILDEPMSGLDPNQAVEIRELIKEIGRERTVIFSTHNMAEAERTCDRLLVITRGEIVADDTAEGLRRAAGNKRYHASFATGVDEERVKKALEGVAGVASVRPVEAKGEVRFELVPKERDADLREAIFRAAVTSGAALLALTGEHENLERRFRELTIGEGSKEEAREAKAKAAKKKAEAKKPEEKKPEAEKKVETKKPEEKKPEPEAKKPEPEAESASAAESVSGSEPGSEPESVSEPESASESVSAPETVSEPAPEPAEAKPEPEKKAVAEAEEKA